MPTELLDVSEGPLYPPEVGARFPTWLRDDPKVHVARQVDLKVHVLGLGRTQLDDFVVCGLDRSRK